MEILKASVSWYTFLQFGVIVTFGITALRAWKHSRARFVELVTAFLFGLLLEQGDIFLFGTYRYNTNWILLGVVPIAIALTWAMIIAGAMNITDALGIGQAWRVESGGKREKREARNEKFVSFMHALPAPMADAVWAILLDLAIDAIAIRLGLWTWTIRADQGWFGVPWGNFFAWLLVAFWFSFFTRWMRSIVIARSAVRDEAISTARRTHDALSWRFAEEIASFLAMTRSQWFVPILAFLALIATLIPFVALENTAALPFVPDDAQAYNNAVWIIFALTLALFVGVTWWSLLKERAAREAADHWLLFVRFAIHALFLIALLATGIYLDAPVLLIVALALLLVEFHLTRAWFVNLALEAINSWRQNFAGARLK